MTEQVERVVEKTIDFEASPERVWRAITDPEQISRWFGHEAVFEATVGFEGAMIWREHGSFALRVEEVTPPSRLVWSWLHEDGVPFDAAIATRIEWTLTPLDGGGTRLNVLESGFRTDLHVQQNTDGWNEELAELVEFLA